MAETRVLTLETTAIPEWDGEDAISSTLSRELQVADPEESQELLNGLRLELPAAIDHQDLVGYSKAHGTPLDESIVADSKQFSFQLIQIPLTILIPDQTPEPSRMVRLRLTVEMTSEGGPVVAYDLYPPDTTSKTPHDLGVLTVDVAKALLFVSPIVGESLGLELTVPLKWSSERVTISTSDRLSNPVEWYIKDQSIQHGLSVYLISRCPRGEPLRLSVSVVCELRKPGLLGRLTKSSFRSGTETYEVVN